MYERLECKEIDLSYAHKATSYFRLESEFFNSSICSDFKYVHGSKIISEVQYGTSKHCSENTNGFSVLRINEIGNCFIKEAAKSCNILTESEYNKLKLTTNDVLIVRTNGNPNLVGRSSVVMENAEVAFASYLYRLKLNRKYINSQTLVAYLNGKFGRQEIDKNSIKGNQTNFSPAKFKDILIPIFSQNFQNRISSIYSIAYKHYVNAKSLYSQAEDLLMSEIGIDIDKIDAGAMQVKSFKNTFGKTGRLDAEYYQGKYDVITSRLNASDTVKSLCNLYDDNYVPNTDIYYKYIELANVGSNGELSGVETIYGDDLPTRARRQVKKGQVIISSIEGSLQSCALITDEFDNALCSTGFYVVDSDIINSETLLVLFKSAPIQSLLKQRCSGTILTAVSKSEFLNTPLCDIDDKIQNKIAEKVRNSFLLRKQAENLLSLATKSVEVAIEGNEDKAIELLRSTDV